MGHGAFLSELSQRVMSFVYEIPGISSARPGREARGRVGTGASHLVSQRKLADAVGTVQEVVVRVMRTGPVAPPTLMA
jgi:hypothetical protein